MCSNRPGSRGAWLPRIGLPQPARPETFPCGPDAWGLVSPSPYADRGWCCSEYAIARLNGRVVNDADADVLDVEASREWPMDVASYSSMMDTSAPRPVTFTKKGDRDAVKYNFFKMTMSKDSIGM